MEVAPETLRIPAVFAAAVVALCIISTVLARGRASVIRAVARTLTIGVVTLLVGLGIGMLLK